MREDTVLTTRRRSIGRLVLLTVCFVSLVGCGSKPKMPPPKDDQPPPPKLWIQATATPDANRGPDNQALPVVVRLYSLKGQGDFATADFFSLFDRDAEILKAQLIARDEVTLAPGQFLLIERPLDPEAAYLGAIAAFRDIDRSRWRDLMPLKVGANNNLIVEVGAESVSIRFR